VRYRLRKGQTLSNLQTVLEGAANLAGSTAHSATAKDLAGWRTGQLALLLPIVESTEALRLVAVDDSAYVRPGAVLANKAQELGLEAERIQEERRRWSEAALFALIDANILAHVAADNPLAEFDWGSALALRTNGTPYRVARLVIPLLVFEQLDGIKDGRKPAQSVQARKVIRTLEQAFIGDFPAQQQVQVPGSASDLQVSVQVWVDPLDHVRLPRADPELVAIAKEIQALAAGSGGRVVVLSHDRGVRFHCRAEGVSSITLADELMRADGPKTFTPA